MATPLTGGEVAAATAHLSSLKSSTSFLDLPAETQREIVAHCSQSDLICLALACKRFHELASAQLYRNFHIIFPDDDDANFDSPVDGLAGGLDTFTTSEYNYAKHLKDLSMDTLSPGVKGEQSYQPYLYSASCGKFLNTLLHLTLKRAHSLESFRWNIRVELSRPVYAQLHRIRSLKKLHIRLQAGDSYYTPPPPLPVTADLDPHPQPNGHWPDTIPPVQSYGPPIPSSIPISGIPPLGPPPSLLPPSSRPMQKSRSGQKCAKNAEPSTLSGFKGLQSMSVLDIDNLEIVGELRTCVKNSFSTLKELQLSLSNTLAQQARKPPQDSDADDSDIEEDFQTVPQPENAVDYNGTGPAKVFRAQEERKLQELILARIFDIQDHHLVKKAPIQLNTPLKLNSNRNLEATTTDSAHRSGDPRSEFVESLTTVSTRLMNTLNGSRHFTISQYESLAIIEKAARKYVDSGSKPALSKCDTNDTMANEGEASNNDSLHEETHEDTHEETHNDETMLIKEDGHLPEEAALTDTAPGSQSSDHPGKMSTNDRKPHYLFEPGSDALPDDIDIEHLETIQDHLDEFHDPQSADPARSRSPLTLRQGPNDAALPRDEDHGAAESPGSLANKPSPEDGKPEFEIAKVDRAAITKKLVQLHRLVRGVGQRVLEIRDERISEDGSIIASDLDIELALLNRSAIEVSNEIRILESEIEDLMEMPMKRSGESTKQSIDAYKRKTRGMSIETLRICLIPVKASVLSQAIDMTCIKDLTLINVGNQAPIWSMLAKEQKNRPLALRSVFTDHVSASFLTCMAQLPVLDDLFMLERGLKHKPESFAPRSATSIDQIRRLVLKKHMPTLKRLMIKDDSNGPNWDANEKTMILICTRGVQLEELALSLNIHAVHAFMQYFSGLVNLRAINILHFKNNDTCIWVMREILRFIVDNLSHHPELKLEWIATEDDRVDRVIRPSEASSESRSQVPLKRTKDKGKDKAHVSPSSPGSAEYPLLPMEALDSDSESDDDSVDSGSRLRFKTIGPLQFYDVWGVKIFDKEIRSGKL
ncbi:hypothetical protein C2857_000415 [Epichloe festucae Fl1]|uniref:F-box domain-containing protein n=1 Tax=Epichloe festucae (strain Fl1) TaxID=877507 RepID=A0A7U3Q130_EPIFF|nr:hypothetical protein C2857_000415 [Epichloe festucae Fl1]